MATERLRGRAEVPLANLEEPLAWLGNESFDLVVSALAMDYVEDWGAPLSEFRRVLKPGGKLVFSVEHPAFRFVFAAMLEPKPDERFRAADQEEYERLCRMPGFLCFVGLKPGAA